MSNEISRRIHFKIQFHRDCTSHVMNQSGRLHTDRNGLKPNPNPESSLILILIKTGPFFDRKNFWIIEISFELGLSEWAIQNGEGVIIKTK